MERGRGGGGSRYAGDTAARSRGGPGYVDRGRIVQVLHLCRDTDRRETVVSKPFGAHLSPVGEHLNDVTDAMIDAADFMDRLSHRQREALTYVAYGFTRDEIAQQMSVTTGYVRVLVSRARERMREMRDQG